MVKLRVVLSAAAALAIGSGTAQAQFTSLVTPPRRPQPAPAMVAQQQAKADSVAHVAVTDMRAWVDSAAGSVGAATATPAESTTVAAPVTTPAPQPQPTTAFREGATAPQTASPLPLLALIGAGALVLGALLLGARPEPRPVRHPRA